MSKLDRWSSNEIAYSRFANGSHYDNRDWCRSEDVERLEADYAKLEASHAELLAAAKDLLKLLNYYAVKYKYMWLAIRPCMEGLRAAIAKAEGEQA